MQNKRSNGIGTGGGGGTYGYGYDAAGRLEDVWVDTVLMSHYDYDDNGNRLKKTDYTSGEAEEYAGAYDEQDRMTTYGPYVYSYSENGELESRRLALSPDSDQFDYDVFGNLRGATLADGTSIEYVIDGQNRRIGKKVNGTLEQGFIYMNQLNPIAELDGSGNVTSLFVYGTRANIPDYMVKGGVTYRIVSDHLGSPRLVVNVATGAVVQRMDYDEFGNVLDDTNPGFQPFGFAGGLYDQDTGLVRFGARDYDAFSGRWNIKDSLFGNMDSPNLYEYSLNDPINWVDMNGFAPAWVGQVNPHA